MGTLARGPVQDKQLGKVYKYVHDMKKLKASHYKPNAHYLMLDADVVWPNDPEGRVHRIFTIVMQYSDQEGECVQNYPAHIVEEDIEIMSRTFQGFVETRIARSPLRGERR